MNRLYRLGALVLSAAVLFSALSGCASTETGDTTVSTDTDTTTTLQDTYDLDAIDDLYLTLAGVAEDTVIATVGDIEMTAGDYLYSATYVCDQIAYMYEYYYGTTDLPWDTDYVEGTTWKEYLTENALTTAALYAIIPQEAEAMGFTATQDMLDAVAVEVEAAKLEVPQGIPTDILFWQMGASEDVYTTIAVSMYLYDEIMNYYLDNGIDGYPSEAEVIAYADAAEAAISPYAAKHILFKTVDDSYAALSEEEVAAQLAKAEDVVAQLESSSDPVALFDELMNELSEDGRDPTTGALYAPDGYETYAGQMVAEFEAAALELGEYEISGIVETTYGYHIIMRLPMDEQEVDYAAYREEMITNAVYDLQSVWMEEYVPVTTDAFADVDIQQFYENLTALYQQVSDTIAAVE